MCVSQCQSVSKDLSATVCPPLSKSLDHPRFQRQGIHSDSIVFIVHMNRGSLSEADERGRCLTGHLILFPFCVKSRQETVDKGQF